MVSSSQTKLLAKRPEQPVTEVSRGRGRFAETFRSRVIATIAESICVGDLFANGFAAGTIVGLSMFENSMLVVLPRAR
jgi:hypothetical protein